MRRRSSLRGRHTRLHLGKLRTTRVKAPRLGQPCGRLLATSERDKRVQLADVLAGSAAHLFAVMTGTKAPDPFARDLAKAGIADLIINPVGPEANLIAMPA